jgi:uncharacterized protein (TIGR03435 family)
MLFFDPLDAHPRPRYVEEDLPAHHPVKSTGTIGAFMLSIPIHRPAFLLATALTLIAAFTPTTHAQTHTQPLEFEAATIKPSAGTGPNVDITANGVVQLHGFSLKGMIVAAFSVDFWQIAGGELWMADKTFDVVGEPPDAIRQSLPDTRHTFFTIADPRLREMLQTLLIERFQLKIHRTTQTGKVYLLERTDKPLAFHPSKVAHPDPAAPQSTYGEITFSGVSGSGDSQLGAWLLFNVTMPEIANYAGASLFHRPVLDHTGVTGGFDYRSAPTDWNSDQKSTFYEFLKDAGLKLTPATGPVEILTIDHAELPTPN